jgi:hypothetical protein
LLQAVVGWDDTYRSTAGYGRLSGPNGCIFWNMVILEKGMILSAYSYCCTNSIFCTHQHGSGSPQLLLYYRASPLSNATSNANHYRSSTVSGVVQGNFICQSYTSGRSCKSSVPTWCRFCLIYRAASGRLTRFIVYLLYTSPDLLSLIILLF